MREENSGREKEVSPEGGETHNLEIICGTGRERKITLSGQESRRQTEQGEDMKTEGRHGNRAREGRKIRVKGRREEFQIRRGKRRRKCIFCIYRSR